MQPGEAVEQGRQNPLGSLLTEEPALTSRLDPAEIRRMLDPSGHTGSAALRARKLADRIDELAAFPVQATPLDPRPSGAARGPSTSSG